VWDEKGRILEWLPSLASRRGVRPSTLYYSIIRAGGRGISRVCRGSSSEVLVVGKTKCVDPSSDIIDTLFDVVD